jgi:hypothetical protein
MLQADPYALILPYFELDSSDKNIPDLGVDHSVANIKDFDTLKRYFSQFLQQDHWQGLY